MRMLITAAALGLIAYAPLGDAREVWRSTRALVPGDLLRPGDAEAHDIAPGRDRPELLGIDQRFVGLEVKRRIPGGQPLSSRDVGAVNLVQASQPVRIFWRQDGISIEMQGRALEGGAEGAEVRVTNGRTSRPLRAKVVGQDTVEIQGLGGE
jgi:flagella basal body P-ring formation protein FlgA